MIKLKDLIQESFDNAASLLLNPKYANTTLDHIIKDFRVEGGTIENGSHGMVFAHPKWNYVLKIFANDDPYLGFVRYVIQHPASSFPKFYDKPRKIIPSYMRPRKNEFMYVVRMEKLEPITEQEFKDIDFYLYYAESDFDKTPDNHVWRETKKIIDRLNSRHPSLKQFLKDYNTVLHHSKVKGALDWSQRNIMKRVNGDYVMTDPFWEGETPYQRADKLQKAEMDYYGYDEPSTEPLIPGGKRFKKPKIQKPKPAPKPMTPDDDVPFQ